MDLIKLTEDIILSLVENKEMVAVKEFPTESDNEILLQVLIDEQDMARVIGKNGKVINAIRTIVQATSYINENKSVKINIDSI